MLINCSWSVLHWRKLDNSSLKRKSQFKKLKMPRIVFADSVFTGGFHWLYIDGNEEVLSIYTAIRPVFAPIIDGPRLSTGGQNVSAVTKYLLNRSDKIDKMAAAAGSDQLLPLGKCRPPVYSRSFDVYIIFYILRYVAVVLPFYWEQYNWR